MRMDRQHVMDTLRSGREVDEVEWAFAETADDTDEHDNELIEFGTDSSRLVGQHTTHDCRDQVSVGDTGA